MPRRAYIMGYLMNPKLTPFLLWITTYLHVSSCVNKTIEVVILFKAKMGQTLRQAQDCVRTRSAAAHEHGADEDICRPRNEISVLLGEDWIPAYAGMTEGRE